MFETLFETASTGTVQPRLAAALPAVDGDVVRIAIRPSVRMHSGQELRAGHVVRALERAMAGPARWLLADLIRTEDTPPIVAIDAYTVELRSARPNDLAFRLAAPPLSILLETGQGRPIGTGPFSATALERGELHLRGFRSAASGAPYLLQVQVLPPLPRTEALQRFELGEVDTSWFGSTLYGGASPASTTTITLPAIGATLLVRNPRSRALSARGAWANIAQRIDRARLERVGLARGPLVETATSAGARAAGTALSLALPVEAGNAFDRRLAEALRGQLDEAGVSVRIDELDPDRYTATLPSASWDLRLATVMPPLPGVLPLVGACLAEAGQLDVAEELVRRGIGNAAAAPAALARLDSIVLGHRAESLSVNADLRGLTTDGLGRLRFERAYWPRRAP
jgi:hypothetical protein